MPETIQTLIVGAGQAGLSASYCLQQNGCEHLILDKASQAVDSWRNQRWDSFTLVTPNLSFRLPGAEYRDADPNGYMKRDEIVNRFEDYIRRNRLPVAYNAPVESVEPENGSGSYLVHTPERTYRARNVILANGWYRVGKIPAFAAKLPPAIFQMHSSHYRNPQSLPPGAVLVVGAAQSGAQIAEELYQSGRKVYLATGGAARAPRRYRGKDIFNWLSEAGFFERPIDLFSHLPNRMWVAPQLSGRDGGHTLNLHQFHRDGVILLGHARDFVDGTMVFASDLKENLAKSDQGEKMVLKIVDDYIRNAGLKVPEEQLPSLTDAYEAVEINALDLQQAGITAIVWATGFRYDATLLKLPVLDDYGYPKTQRGASAHPGLYFIGIPFLSKLKSGFIFGVAEDAAAIAQHIANRN